MVATALRWAGRALLSALFEQPAAAPVPPTGEVASDSSDPRRSYDKVWAARPTPTRC